ncbi:hypothetical protein CERSUDRAFT_93496 [Gelatoporia subvermispora B]|uniref:Uncharacterized protein n=1 Tax=Ceriporiopsis subvermispora (strain B) TaxID=914234 RepID=M2PNH7_CERS8|nr:hypothetical protein CERSUDRAFT_93496 [Gelatoporia subvermispora B]
MAGRRHWGKKGLRQTNRGPLTGTSSSHRGNADQSAARSPAPATSSASPKALSLTALLPEDGSSCHATQAGQHSVQSVPSDVYVSVPTQLESIFLAALEKYKQRTNKDPTKGPFIDQLEKCKTPSEVMEILEKPINDFIDCQNNGNSKAGLMRLLNQMVDVLLALHLSETVGEGISTVWEPRKAVIGAVVVLLETIRDVREGYKMLMDLLEDVSSFIIHLKVYCTSTIFTEMRGILVKTLVEVMSILGLATEQIREGHFKRYIKTLLRDSVIEDAFKKLNRLTSVETRMASTESLKVLYDLVSSLSLLMQDVQTPIKAIHTDLDNLNDSIDNIERDVNEMNCNDMVRDCRKWLSSPDPSANHRAALDLHHEGTATWLIEGKTMQEWKIAGSLLWIYGKSGSGKTVLW